MMDDQLKEDLLVEYRDLRSVVTAWPYKSIAWSQDWQRYLLLVDIIERLYGKEALND